MTFGIEFDPVEIVNFGTILLWFLNSKVDMYTSCVIIRDDHGFRVDPAKFETRCIDF